jgi:hypothetical protein
MPYLRFSKHYKLFLIIANFVITDFTGKIFIFAKKLPVINFQWRYKQFK